MSGHRVVMVVSYFASDADKLDAVSTANGLVSVLQRYGDAFGVEGWTVAKGSIDNEPWPDYSICTCGTPMECAVHPDEWRKEGWTQRDPLGHVVRPAEDREDED